MDGLKSNVLCEVPEEDILGLAERVAARGLSTRSDKKLLARIGLCKFSTELYLRAKAEAMGKELVFVENGQAIAEVPVE